MADDRTTAQRSETMRRVRSEGTSCERSLLSALRRSGVRARAHSPTAATLPGSPDLVFVRARVAVFVDGCFWHGCPTHCRLPATNRTYWRTKVRRNMARDRAAVLALRAAGWSVVRLWEHAVRADADASARRVMAAVRRGKCRSGA